MLMAMKQPGLGPLRLKLYLRKTQIAREHPARSGSGVWFSASVHAVSHGQGSFHAVGSLSANLGLILKILTVSECPQGTHGREGGVHPLLQTDFSSEKFQASHLR